MFTSDTRNLSRPRLLESRTDGRPAHWRLAVAALLAVLLPACSSMSPPIPPAPPAEVPMPYLSYQTDATGQHRNLLVLLRGYGDDNGIFAREGVIEEVRKRHLPFDVIAPDAHFGYYRTQTFEVRLKEDIIEPARRRGYEHIWLAGFSMGGLGCILYLRKYPHDVDGVLLTSPFLGWPSIFREIKGDGGLAAWNRTTDDPHHWERMLWTWIKYHDFAAAPPIWMGYGDQDHLVSGGPPLLASLLPAKRAFTVHGEHDIATFKAIFLRHLDLLARRSRTIAASSSVRAEPSTSAPQGGGVAAVIPLARAAGP